MEAAVKQERKTSFRICDVLGPDLSSSAPTSVSATAPLDLSSKPALAVTPPPHHLLSHLLSRSPLSPLYPSLPPYYHPARPLFTPLPPCPP